MEAGRCRERVLSAAYGTVPADYWPLSEEGYVFREREMQIIQAEVLAQQEDGHGISSDRQ
jgi:hypothetical protein